MKVLFPNRLTPLGSAAVGVVVCRTISSSSSPFFVANAFSSPSNPNTPEAAAIGNSKHTNRKLQYLEAILWDMDGVLADTERDAHRPAFNQVFADDGLDTEWTEDRYGKLLEVGGGKERMTAHWTEVGWPAALQTLSDEEKQAKVKELHLRKTDVFMGLINQGDVPLRPGVLRVIDSAIVAGLTLAVCSTSNELAVRNLVQSK